MEMGRRKEMVKAQPLVKLTSRISGLCDDAEKETKKKKKKKTLTLWVSQQLSEKQAF